MWRGWAVLGGLGCVAMAFGMVYDVQGAINLAICVSVIGGALLLICSLFVPD